MLVIVKVGGNLISGKLVGEVKRRREEEKGGREGKGEEKGREGGRIRLKDKKIKR